MASYKVISIPDVEQTPKDMSFKGGVPNLPQRFEIPLCLQCGAEMTFYFQIAFPKKHVWEGKVMAFSHCTSCYTIDNNWPMLLYLRERINIPDNTLDTYQTNFRICVFDVSEPAILHHDFAKRIKFERLTFEKVNPRAKYDNMTKVGGKPAWQRDAEDKLYKEITYIRLSAPLLRILLINPFGENAVLDTACHGKWY